MRKLLGTAVLLGLLAAGCGSSGGGGSPGGGSGSGGHADPPSAPAPPFDATLVVVDESGATLPQALVTTDGIPAPVGGNGRLTLASLPGPVLAVVSAPGFLPEPVALGRDDAAAPTTVRLFAETGLSGARRFAVHFGGDSMMARRYLSPGREGTAVVTTGDGGASARAVVSSLAPLFRAADFRTLNLETVVGALPDGDAYPGKIFLLQSPPEVLAALDELGIMLANRANNHARDWLDEGILSTTSALDAGGFPWVGAGLGEQEAAASRTVTAVGVLAGFLSYTTLDGDTFNDGLPDDGDPIPSSVNPEDAWQYQSRLFGFASANIDIPVQPRRPGSAWIAIEGADLQTSDPAEIAALWAAGAVVYPELQDWVARRGHGGANRLPLSAQMAAEIGALRSAGCDFIVVQLHTGFQFVDTKSRGTELAAEKAIEAGADFVSCHHPHVLQGFQWYQGKLIAWSLGNLFFDQDFLTTFSTCVVRAVFEKTGPGASALLEARVFPIVVDSYRPVPLVGAGAQYVAGILAERSLREARSDRIGGVIASFLAPPPAGASSPGLLVERNSARIVAAPPSPTTLAVSAERDRALSLPPGPLTRSRAPGGAALPAGLLFGRDIFGWGSFEDETADGAAAGGLHWVTDAPWKRIEVREDAPSGVRCLRLRRTSNDSQRVLARPVARVTLPSHRAYVDQSGTAVPADGPGSWSARLMARFDGTQAGTDPFFRLDMYHFDDTNPTEDPDSILLRSVELPLPVVADGAWHELLVDIPPTALAPVAGRAANMALFYIGMKPPGDGAAVLLLDDVQFLEWREARALADGLYQIDAVRAAGAGPAIPATLERVPLSGP